MDDLDRLYFELVEAVRGGRAAVGEPMTVGDLHERVIPYRRVRDRVGFRSNDDYEVAFSRLIAGERDYVLGDPVMQDDLRHALADLLPDIRRHRTHQNQRVRLNPASVPPPGDIRYAPPELREREEWRWPPAPPPDEGEQGDHEPAEPTALASPDLEVPPAQEVEPPGDEIDAATDFDASGSGSCPGCGEPLAERATFCPFCGGRLESDRCVSCGTGLQPDWRFCPDCGTPRQVGGDPA